MNCLSGWTIISRQDLKELANPANWDTDKRIRDARREYYNVHKFCVSELKKHEELKRISKKYNIKEEVILEYV